MRFAVAMHNSEQRQAYSESYTGFFERMLYDYLCIRNALLQLMYDYTEAIGSEGKLHTALCS